MKTKICIIIIFILIVSSAGNSSGQSAGRNWDRFNYLLGEWMGESNGQPGKGEGTFSFREDLGKNILVRTGHTEFPATKEQPQVIHDDLIIIYKDFAGNPVKAIYFDNESHVIHYSVTFTDNAIVFTSDVLENLPTFRLIYTRQDDITVNIKFEMTAQGKPGEFFTYIEGNSVKKK